MRNVLLFLLAANGSVLAGCSGDDSCDIESYTRELGGSGLTDCGLARPGNPDVVDGCAVMAHNQNKTFRALYANAEGEVEGLVYSSDRKLYDVRSVGSTIERATCEGAVVIKDDGRVYVECDSPGERDVVCE